MIRPQDFIHSLQESGIDFFTGVPDSLLKSFCACLTDTVPKEQHIIAANEGGAVALATGYHLATGKIGLVYMQNSGEGNAVNPLLSLTDKAVYDIPLLLLIGWRGEPGTKDEPQHITQGRLTLPLLETMSIPSLILDEQQWQQQIATATQHLNTQGGTYALIVRKGTFDNYQMQPHADISTLEREKAIQTIASTISKDELIVATTGMISRELFEYRESINFGHGNDFLTVGSMGHASQIALAIAINKPATRVWCFDGDGAALMHLGGIALIGTKKPKNFVHIIFNNAAHDSVGGQPTAGTDANLTGIAQSVGYTKTWTTDQLQNLREIVEEAKNTEGPVLIEVLVKKGARPDLGRPTTTPIQNKETFMLTLQRLK